MLIDAYENGGYFVRIFSDGTKIREKLSDKLPEYPESIDLKITDYCDLNCPFCHEKSSILGKHADLSLPILDTFVSGMELAIGGGNPLSHPDLDSFLIRMQNKGVICNITINLKHLTPDNIAVLKTLQKAKLLYGIGISITNNSVIPDLELSNVVFHIINRMVSQEYFEKVCSLHNVLVLGYKSWGRGKIFVPPFKDLIIKESKNIIAFDNLAIKQLNLDTSGENYMGSDGEFTMYIDLVSKQYAVSSISENKFDLPNNIKGAFKNILG